MITSPSLRKKNSIKWIIITQAVHDLEILYFRKLKESDAASCISRVNRYQIYPRGLDPVFSVKYQIKGVTDDHINQRNEETYLTSAVGNSNYTSKECKLIMNHMLNVV